MTAVAYQTANDTLRTVSESMDLLNKTMVYWIHVHGAPQERELRQQYHGEVAPRRWMERWGRWKMEGG